MANIVGLSSIRPSHMDLTYIQVPEFDYSHLFKIDKLIRATYKENPKSEWKDVVRSLEGGGYPFLPRPRNSEIFVFFRAWDEYMLNDGESFLVSFPPTAAYELRNKFYLATPYPMFYAAVNSAYPGGQGRVLLINEAHEPMYPCDTVWSDSEQTERIPLGDVYLVKDQFPSESEYLKAKDILLSSGYFVGDTPGSWVVNQNFS